MLKLCRLLSFMIKAFLVQVNYINNVIAVYNITKSACFTNWCTTAIFFIIMCGDYRKWISAG